MKILTLQGACWRLAFLHHLSYSEGHSRSDQPSFIQAVFENSALLKRTAYRLGFRDQVGPVWGKCGSATIEEIEQIISLVKADSDRK